MASLREAPGRAGAQLLLRRLAAVAVVPGAVVRVVVAPAVAVPAVGARAAVGRAVVVAVELFGPHNSIKAIGAGECQSAAPSTADHNMTFGAAR